MKEMEEEPSRKRGRSPLIMQGTGIDILVQRGLRCPAALIKKAG